ncbi:MAG: Hsp70 family protein [Planctomycetota bacterium]|jgi:molecular chaperone DnaK (HSP70)|nr:Hsp70 family protein [Planctomycetota bacterium]
MSEDLIVGIDLGTTNSSVAAYVDGTVRVLGPGDKLLPSCLGLSDDGALLVGGPARNQALLHPERTLKSVKRRMGEDVSLPLGDRVLTPPEASALLLRKLADWAEKELGQRPERAVITVPAYFTDAQRNATREAGAIAGLDVVRLLNEPTAASLAYGEGTSGKADTALVYDLGGGTFDVSIVRVEGDVTEVLASHGDTRLGGDDFTDLLAGRLRERFLQKHGPHSLDEQPAAAARLWWTAEAAKRRLSEEPYVLIREEHLVADKTSSLHLETEIGREEYNNLIFPLLERSLESVTRAREAAGAAGRDLDAILLVGGSTRTPLVAELLRERSRMEPLRELHPDLCVALGAGTLAARLSGKGVERILVDVSAHSFGVSYLGPRNGMPYEYCYKPILERNTPLPLTRSEVFYTAEAYQEEVHVKVFQGENPDALLNIPIGDFRVSGLRPRQDPNPVVMRMSLDLDGVLHASATEKDTGLRKEIVIDGATRTRTPEEIAAARTAMADLHATGLGFNDYDDGQDGEEYAESREIVDERETPDSGSDEDAEPPPAPDAGIPDANPPSAPAPEQATGGANSELMAQAAALRGRALTLFEKLHADDRKDISRLSANIDKATDDGELREAVEELRELLYFVEGR